MSSTWTCWSRLWHSWLLRNLIRLTPLRAPKAQSTTLSLHNSKAAKKVNAPAATHSSSKAPISKWMNIYFLTVANSNFYSTGRLLQKLTSCKKAQAKPQKCRSKSVVTPLTKSSPTGWCPCWDKLMLLQLKLKSMNSSITSKRWSIKTVATKLTSSAKSMSRLLENTTDRTSSSSSITSKSRMMNKLSAKRSTETSTIILKQSEAKWLKMWPSQEKKMS